MCIHSSSAHTRREWRISKQVVVKEMTTTLENLISDLSRGSRQRQVEMATRHEVAFYKPEARGRCSTAIKVIALDASVVYFFFASSE